MSIETDTSGPEIDDSHEIDTHTPEEHETKESEETPEDYDLQVSDETPSAELQEETAEDYEKAVSEPLEEEKEEIKEETPEDYDKAVEPPKGIEEKAYPCIEKVDGVKHYYDTNGELYRIGDNLQPNTAYEINGYKYRTDEFARIECAEGKLQLKGDRKHLPINDSMESIGKGDQLKTDDRGHLIGDQFEGINRLENLVPQDSNVNRKEMRNFENELAKEVRNGKNVYVRVEPIYEDNSRRPTDIMFSYTIDDVEQMRLFHNTKE